ncbi:hypothetical protein O3P69_011545 [Scylla paramamosain]|uniref:Uncharacterized protein n=1 Tax=Scylla paramamosain TaxID=85552 RepID=A0AAW0T6V0_SCYPA
MLKWTLRNPPDAPTPPPPEVTFRAHEGEGRVNLKDSNTCWLETQVKVAQVRSTSKVIENGEGENGKENEGLLQKWRSAHQHHHHHHHHHEEKKRRRKQHKHTRCNPLDPLRLFTGEVTDSDSGSVYMRLEHTPAALLPRPPHHPPTTGPADPRRKPLIDLSNGDYSDVRKYLQSLSTSSLHPHYPHHHYHHHYHPHPHPHPHQHAHHLPPYLQPFARSTKGSFQRGPGPGPLVRPDPLGASASSYRKNIAPAPPPPPGRGLAPRPCPVLVLLAPLVTPGSRREARGAARGRACPRPSSDTLSRTFPSAACGVLRGVWEAQKERRGRSVSHDRRRRSRDLKKEGEEEEKDGQRMEGRKARRERRKEEPIYEKVGGESSPSTAANSGSSLASKNSRTSYDNVIYMSMKDLRAQYTQEGEEGSGLAKRGSLLRLCLPSAMGSASRPPRTHSTKTSCTCP